MTIMKEISRDEAQEKTYAVLNARRKRNQQLAEKWWNYIGNPRIARRAAKGKYKAKFIIPSFLTSSITTIIWQKKFRYYTQTSFAIFNKLECRWD